MTSHYLQIRLRDDPDITTSQIMNALYAKLHRALVQWGNGQIGVSFPGAQPQNLGGTMRLHGQGEALHRLVVQPWLQGLSDLVQVDTIQSAPADTRHRCVYRVQAKSGVERLRRRAIKRHGINEQTAQERIPDSIGERLNLPFVQLGSQSTGQPRFYLFIAHGPLQDESKTGVFSSYGLSREGTVPWF